MSSSSKIRKNSSFLSTSGTSRLPCDCDFARIKKRRRKDRVVKPSEWVNEIKNNSILNPFQIAYMEHLLTDDLSNNSIPVIKVKDYKKRFDLFLRPPKGIVTIRELLFRRGQQPMCHFSMTGDCLTEMCILKRGKNLRELLCASKNLLPTYLNFLKIKKAKFNDIKTLLGYVTISDDVTFYNPLSAQSEKQQESDLKEEVK